MRKGLFFFIAILSITVASAQNTINSTGNWDNTGIWSSSNIADAVTEDVSFAGGGDKTATVRSGFNYTVGNVDLASNGNLSIVGTLNVGASGNPKNLTANNTPNVAVSGTLIIWGDLIVNNSMTWTISGSVTIKGNVIMNNSATLVVSGGLTIDGNFTGGNNTQVTNSGNIAVGGTVTVGGGTTSLTNSGTFTAGNCNPQGSGFCGNVVLPVTLLFFKGDVINDQVELTWATATEINFDHFVLEKTVNGKDFFAIGNIKGAGNTSTRQDYRYIDPIPTSGRSYYRLKSVDFDGKTEYFDLVRIDYYGSKQVVVSPNPTSGSEITVFMNFRSETNTQIIVMDVFGKEYFRTDIENTFGQNVLQGELAAGTYILKTNSGSDHFTTRFIVR